MRFKILLFAAMVFYNVKGTNLPVIIEAESGTLGSDYSVLTAGEVTYITPQTNFINGAFPGSADKVATYTVVFADSGTYKLYIRARIGAAGADDDSYFHGNGFGTKDPLLDGDWITSNNITSAGFSIPGDVVDGPGDAATQLWKWLSVSDFTGQEAAITFRVELGELTKTFQIGARENGFDIDKIAFGMQGVYFTVNNLDNGEAGSLFPPGEEPVGPPLADGLDKFLGCVYSFSTRRDFEGYWNQVTPENAGKWASVEGTRDVMSWTGLDEAYNFAMDNDFVYRHHVLIWGNQQPNWMAALDSAEQHAEIEEWFQAVADKYPMIHQIEVVNEPLHDPPDDPEDGGYIDALGGAGVTGWDWIIEAFRMARSIFPDTTMLIINEYNIMNSIPNTDTYLGIIRLLQQDSLIDGIGLQGHGFSHNTSNSIIARNLDSLAGTGLPIYVTEFDVDGETDLKQVNTYMRIFPLFWEHPSVKGITLWGFRPGMWRTAQGAYLIDAQGNERPAMAWLRAYLKNEFVPNGSITISTLTGESAIETVGGTLQMIASIEPENATLKTVHWTVSNNNIATIDANGVLTAVSNGTVTVRGRSLEYESTVSGEMEITITGQTTSVETIAGAEDIFIYPNPAFGGRFSIEGTSNITSVTILDLNGRIIRTVDVNNREEVEINLDVPAGLYLVRLTDGYKYYHAKVSVR